MKNATTVPAAARRTVIVVDELAPVNVNVLFTTVVFNPGQVLSDPYAIGLAREHGVFLRERTSEV